MKKFKKLIFLIMASCLTTNVVAYCETDYIKSKTSDGSVIILGSGDSWEIDSFDRINSALWLRMDDVLVCDDSIIHKDDGEKVSARKIS